jgi:phosphoribosylformylglycinamidine synthase
VDPKVWREMGLNDEEYNKIVSLLGREPNYLEVGIFSVMWSEHCSYKTSKPVLRSFQQRVLKFYRDLVKNAGIVDIGDNPGCCFFKMESHNILRRLSLTKAQQPGSVVF